MTDFTNDKKHSIIYKVQMTCIILGSVALAFLLWISLNSLTKLEKRLNQIQVSGTTYELEELTPEIIKKSVLSENHGGNYQESSLDIKFDPNSDKIITHIIRLYKQAFPNREFIGYRLNRIQIILGTKSDRMEFFIAHQFKY